MSVNELPNELDHVTDTDSVMKTSDDRAKQKAKMDVVYGRLLASERCVSQDKSSEIVVYGRTRRQTHELRKSEA